MLVTAAEFGGAAGTGIFVGAPGEAGVFGVLGDIGEDVCHAGHAFACRFDVEFGYWVGSLGPISARLDSRLRGNDRIVRGNGGFLVAVVVAIFSAIGHGVNCCRLGSGEFFLECEEADGSLYAVYGVFAIAVGAHFVGEFAGDGCAADHDADLVAESDVFEV